MNLASLAERNLAEYGEYERLVVDDAAGSLQGAKRLTNRDLHAASCRLAAALHALGCRAGDKVVLMMPNAPEVLVAYPGIWRAGLAVIPVLFVLEAKELGYIVANSGAKVVITAPELVPKVAQAMSGLAAAGAREPVLIVTGSAATPAGWLSFEELLRTSAPLAEPAPREEGDPATILYTSGTTGQPKGVVQTHKNLLANAMNSWNSQTTRRRGETILLMLPLAHTFGLAVLISGYLYGSRGILMRRFEPERALALIQEHKVASMAGVPTMFLMMARHPSLARHDVSSVQRCLVGAAPMPHPQIEEFEQKFGCPLYMGYGLSEAGPGVAGEREGMPRKKGSTGIALSGVEVKIVDDDGRELPRGTVGEICAKGDNVSPGYYENGAASAEAFRGGWLFTGDAGYLDEDGYLFVVERKKDLIIRGGLNVYPKDVEDVIQRMPEVLEVAVVGVPSVQMGEEVCAMIVKRPGAEASAADVIAHCQSHLAKYKTPRYVAFVDALPKTVLGKIRKKELRELAAARFEGAS